MPAYGSRDRVGLMRIAGSISLVIVSCIALTLLYKAEDASNVQLESASDLDWGAFNQQLSHDWHVI
jgi:hypothetical protein